LPEIKNPNAGGGGQDSRSFLVMMVVMIGVIFGVQYWRGEHTPPPTPAATAPAAVPTTAPAPTPAAASRNAKTAAAATPTVQAASETSTVVENELYRITFSNRGGEVRSWILKNYKDNAGQPLDLVHLGASTLFGYPLSLYTYDAGLNKQLATAMYVPSATGMLESPATLRFDYAADNIAVHKTFTFGADYVLHADTVVLRDGAPIRALLNWPSALGDMETALAYASAQLDTGANGHDDHTALKKITGGATLNGPFDFAGFSDQYFAAIFLPDAPTDATAVTLHNNIDIQEVTTPQPWYRFGSATTLSKTEFYPSTGAASPKGQLRLPVLGTAVGDLSGHNQLRLFVGPKAIGVLKSIHTADNRSLEPVLDFGFWGPIGKYLFLGLRAVHSWLPHANEATSAAGNRSWGWAIVLFTIFLNLLLLPLRVQGMRSALKMQRIQPLIDTIKAKYKNPKATDPKMAEMNAEIMATQKEHGVSMFGGCIPALVQFPLLFAFFTMMTKVVELRQAHFFWLPDLSAADPYHILPILMMGTSFLVQFYTPSPGVDPQQQKMMAFMMPAFSGYFTWNYASGLALYWNVGNLIMIIQQAVMNRTSMGQEMRAIAAKRAQRKAAARSPGPAQRAPSKTIQGRR
jgi:YidC/Oxa1 family membrane protein insertase